MTTIAVTVTEKKHDIRTPGTDIMPLKTYFVRVMGEYMNCNVGEIMMPSMFFWENR